MSLLRGGHAGNFHIGHFRHQRSLLHNLFQGPALQLRQRPRLFDLHHVARMSFVLLIMRVELLADRDHASVHGMRLFPRHFDHDRLLHLVREHDPDQLLVMLLSLCPCLIGSLACRFRHYFFSVFVFGCACVLVCVLCPAISCSRRIVCTRAMSRRSPRTFFRLSVCPIFIWNFSLKSWSAKSRSWCLSSTSVKLRIFSAFIKSVPASKLIRSQLSVLRKFFPSAASDLCNSYSTS